MGFYKVTFINILLYSFFSLKIITISVFFIENRKEKGDKPKMKISFFAYTLTFFQKLKRTPEGVLFFYIAFFIQSSGSI